MKKSYIKLFVLDIILFIFLVLNSFVSSILSRYNLAICLVLLLILFKRLFGFEKDRHRFTKDVIIEIIIFLLIYFLAYYVFGLVIGFYRAGNYLSLVGLRDFIIPTILIVLLKEFFRYNILTKSEGNKTLIVCTILLFIFLDVTNALYYGNFNTLYETFVFVALSLMPAISTNILCSYMTIKSGYKPVIVYQLVMSLYVYILPIIPNPSEYVSSVIQFVVPIILTFKLYVLFDKYKNKVVDRNYNKKSMMPFVPTLIIIMILVYFVSGYFHFHAVAIASGSMSPVIKKGDVVVIEKIDGDYDSIENGQVIAYKHGSVVVVHRLIDIVESDNKYYFYTQGDANEDPDDWVVNESDIIGVVNVKIPFIGLPTVWINEL